MDGALIAALITGPCAIAAPLITFAATKMYETRLLAPISRARQRALRGEWKGEMTQSAVLDGGIVRGSLQAGLSPGRKKLTGTATLVVRVGGIEHIIPLVLDGGFYDGGHFLRLDYRNKDDAKYQFGALVLQLDALAGKLTGGYVGYGSLHERVVRGDVSLEKVA